MLSDDFSISNGNVQIIICEQYKIYKHITVFKHAPVSVLMSQTLIGRNIFCFRTRVKLSFTLFAIIFYQKGIKHVKKQLL